MDDYALVPEHEVEELKRQVQELRKNPLGSTPEGKELTEQIESLNQTLHSLMNFFKEASESLERYETKPKESPRVESKVDELIEQNKKIAKGIIAVADMVRDLSVKIDTKPEPAPEPKPRMQARQPDFGMPSIQDFEMPNQQAPPSMPEFDDNLPPLPGNLPPLGPAPNPPRQKKKLFGF